MNYITSDLHFGHTNIIEYCNRPWKTSEEMDEALFANLSFLKPNDTLWILGDVAFRNKDFARTIAQRLAKLPPKIKIIGGNHDRGKTQIYKEFGLLEHESGRFDYELDGIKVSMGHFPVTEDIGLSICGHIHTDFKVNDFNVNVGVDVWNYKPITLNDIVDADIEYLIQKVRF